MELLILIIIVFTFWFFLLRAPEKPKKTNISNTSKTVNQSNIVEKNKNKNKNKKDIKNGFPKKCSIAGVTFLNSDGTSRQEIIKKCQPGLKIDLIHDIHNSCDSFAISIITPYGCIGFIPKKFNKSLIDIGLNTIEAKIDSIYSYNNRFGVTIKITNNDCIFDSFKNRVIFPNYRDIDIEIISRKINEIRKDDFISLNNISVLTTTDHLEKLNSLKQEIEWINDIQINNFDDIEKHLNRYFSICGRVRLKDDTHCFRLVIENTNDTRLFIYFKNKEIGEITECKIRETVIKLLRIGVDVFVDESSFKFEDQKLTVSLNTYSWAFKNFQNHHLYCSFIGIGELHTSLFTGHIRKTLSPTINDAEIFLGIDTDGSYLAFDKRTMKFQPKGYRTVYFMKDNSFEVRNIPTIEWGDSKYIHYTNSTDPVSVKVKAYELYTLNLDKIVIYNANLLRERFKEHNFKRGFPILIDHKNIHFQYIDNNYNIKSAYSSYFTYVDICRYNWKEPLSYIDYYIEYYIYQMEDTSFLCDIPITERKYNFK